MFPAPVSRKWGQGGLDAVEHAVQVRIDDVIPLLLGQLVDALADPGTRVQEQHVQPAEALKRRRDHRLVRRPLGDVAEHEERLPAVGLDQPVDARLPGLQPVDADDLGALAGEQPRGGAPDAAIGARHYRHAPFEPAEARPDARVLVVRRCHPSPPGRPRTHEGPGTSGPRPSRPPLFWGAARPGPPSRSSPSAGHRVPSRRSEPRHCSSKRSRPSCR